MLDLGNERRLNAGHGAPKTAPAGSSQSPPAVELEPVDLLLVDDRLDGLITLEAVLKGPRYRLTTASSGREAIARARERNFAAILLDVQMPGMDGFETARRIREIEGVKRVPIIFVTAISKDLSHVYEGYDSGAVDYIFKPFDPRVLSSKVSVFADLHRQAIKIERQADALRESERLRFAEQVSKIELESAHRYKALIDAVPHIVGLLNQDRTSELLNKSWFEYTGLNEERSLGLGWRTPFSPEDLDRLDQALSTITGSHQTTRLECRILDSEGALRWHLVTLEGQPSGSEGRPGCYLLTATDVDAVKRGEIENARLFEQEKAAVEKLEEQKVALERSNHDLEQFAYVASHDLQEPLRKVTTFMDLLTRRYASLLPEEAQKFVSYAVDGATRMHDLINGLLAYSRVDRLGDKPEEISVSHVVEEVLADLAHPIRKTGANVKWDGLPVITAEPTQLRQLFQNLIGNALKFCDGRAPKIDIACAENDDEWRFSVADNGIGIEPEYADKIFLIFQRLHPKGRYPGSGIGLAICKKIVERHDGRIWFDSVKDQGTTFHFTIAKK